MKGTLLLGAILVLVSGCYFGKIQKANKNTNNILKQLTGNFNNQAQILNLPDSVAKKYTPNKPWCQLLYATHKKVFMVNFGQHVIYLCWRKDSANGAVERQRIWVFNTNSLGNTYMQFYAFANDTIAKSVAANIDNLKAIFSKNLIAYNDSCTIPFLKTRNGFVGNLNPNACVITAQKSGRKMGLLAKIETTQFGFNYNEAGLLTNEIKAFEVPGVDMYTFIKVK